MIDAVLVYDGEYGVHVPAAMGRPRADQLRGTEAEQLAELAGRVCYDSLGSGRSSEEFHKHILESKHLSVWRHFNFEVTIRQTPDERSLSRQFYALANRPGIHFYLSPMSDGSKRVELVICANICAVIEWDRWTQDENEKSIPYLLRHAAMNLAPQAFGVIPSPGDSHFSKPIHPEHQWVTLYLAMGRTASHEQVRHDHRTAVSQRSTRYCDESESEWVDHPLRSKLLSSMLPNMATSLYDRGEDIKRVAQQHYRDAVFYAEQYLRAEGADKLTARKQARGMARGVLGNSLQTEMLFSASVAQWKRMIEQRLTNAADAEIRLLYGKVLDELRLSRYGHAFKCRIERAKDGLGWVFVEWISSS